MVKTMKNNKAKILLSDIATVELCNVDKKININEKSVLQCNYTDVYCNWQITKLKAKSFLQVTCTEGEYEKFRLREGQVAITKDSETRDDIGIPSYIAESLEDVVLGYHLALITPNSKKLNGYFLNCLLRTDTYKKYFENNATGSGQRAALSIATLRNIPLVMPDLTEQENIAKILSQLDDKIEINNKINEELEDIAKTIYDYWFVQFDFPDENGKPYRSSGGAMVYNPILKREIPQGWEVKELGDYCKIESGFPFDSQTYLQKGKYKIITIKSVQDGALDTTKSSKINVLPENLPTQYILDIGDIVMSLTGNVARLCFIDEVNLLLNQRVGLVTTINKEIHSYIYMLLSSKEVKAKLIRISGGTSQKNLSPLEAEKVKVISPSEAVIKKFCINLDKLLKLIVANKQQNKQLAELRDFLLPLLMNGQVTIKL